MNISAGTPGSANTRQGVPLGARHSEVDAGGRAFRVRHHATAARELRLQLVAFRHRTFALCEKILNVGEGGRVFNQLQAGGGSQGVAGQVIGRGAEAAGAHHDVGPCDRSAKHGDIGVEVVAHRGVEHHGNAQLSEPLAEPLAVRIQPLAAGEFVTNRNDFGRHGRKS